MDTSVGSSRPVFSSNSAANSHTVLEPCGRLTVFARACLARSYFQICPTMQARKMPSPGVVFQPGDTGKLSTNHGQHPRGGVCSFKHWKQAYERLPILTRSFCSRDAQGDDIQRCLAIVDAVKTNPNTPNASTISFSARSA